jgi:hypothetical protein
LTNAAVNLAGRAQHQGTLPSININHQPAPAAAAAPAPAPVPAAHTAQPPRTFLLLPPPSLLSSHNETDGRSAPNRAKTRRTRGADPVIRRPLGGRESVREERSYDDGGGEGGGREEGRGGGWNVTAFTCLVLYCIVLVLYSTCYSTCYSTRIVQYSTRIAGEWAAVLHRIAWI